MRKFIELVFLPIYLMTILFKKIKKYQSPFIPYDGYNLLSFKTFISITLSWMLEASGKIELVRFTVFSLTYMGILFGQLIYNDVDILLALIFGYLLSPIYYTLFYILTSLFIVTAMKVLYFILSIKKL